MMKVKITCFWEDSPSFLKTIRQFSFGQDSWKNLEFVDHDNYDRLIILTRPHADCTYDPRKALTLLTEPPGSPNHRVHETSGTVPMYLPLPFWQHISEKDQPKIARTRIAKWNLLSSVTSELCFMTGHMKRLELVGLLDNAIEEGFSLWGRSYGKQFLPRLRSYKGEIADKYKALWSYKYHFACENSFIDDYFTEKICDPIIAECLCFYDGCRNIEAFIDEKAFLRINVAEPEEAVEVIIKSICDNEWRKRIRFIREQKRRLLYHLNPLNIMWMALNEKDVYKECRL